MLFLKESSITESVDVIRDFTTLVILIVCLVIKTVKHVRVLLPRIAQVVKILITEATQQNSANAKKSIMR
jgi:hypothetical protein